MLKTIQDAVEGKKQMIASLVTAVVATGTILNKFGDQGIAYLLGVAQTPEFAAASLGWIGFFNALKGEKTRNEIANLSAQMNQPKEIVKTESTTITSQPIEIQKV